MRLTDRQWQDVQADYEIRGLSYNELTTKYNTARSTIRGYIKKHGWIKDKTAPIAKEKAHAIKVLEVTEQETALFSAPLKKAFDEQVNFQLQNDRDMQRIQIKANAMVDNAENPQDVSALMALTAKHREARLGKQPTQQVNIQTNVNVIDPFADD